MTELEIVAKEIIERYFDCCYHDRMPLFNAIATALTAAEQRGAERQREKDAQIAETVATREDVVRAIRSNQ